MLPVIDIKASKDGSAGLLSNFTNFPFRFRGFDIASMEALLQSLKQPDPTLQRQMLHLTGKKAKQAGQHLEWWHTGLLYWQGQAIDRFGPSYQQFLDHVYNALAGNSGFRKALLITGDCELCHSIGTETENFTILTEEEFVYQLYRLRSRFRHSAYQWIGV